MGIAVKCRVCGKGYKVDLQVADKRFKCKNCGNLVRVPAQPQADPGDDLLDESAQMEGEAPICKDQNAPGFPARVRGKSKRRGGSSERGDGSEGSFINPSASSPEAESASVYALSNSEDASVGISSSAPPHATHKRRKTKRQRPPQTPPISALWYPLTGSGSMVLMLYAFLLGVAPLIPVPLLGPLVTLVVAAYIGLLFLETASFTVSGIPQGPRLPGLSFENVTAGVFSLAAVLISQIPRFVGGFFIGQTGDVSLIVILLLTMVGFYYVPMAFLALAVLENERALNPILVVRGISRMPGAYLALVTLAGVAFIVLSLLIRLLRLPVPVVYLGSNFVLIYVTVALMRAVALVYIRRGLKLDD